MDKCIRNNVMDKYIMSKKEIEQLRVFEKLKAKEISKAAAAQLLGMAERGMRKKFKRYQTEGVKGLIHKSRGRPSPRRWGGEQRALAVSLLNSELYKGFGPTFATEQLAQHGIKISKETIRKLMIEEGLWQNKKQRAIYRKRRERKPALGNMIQLDGSDHDWFPSRWVRRKRPPLYSFSV